MRTVSETARERARAVAALAGLLSACVLEWPQVGRREEPLNRGNDASEPASPPRDAGVTQPPREASLDVGPDPIDADGPGEDPLEPEDGGMDEAEAAAADAATCGCLNEGVCSDAGCVCTSGFTGPDCALAICQDITIDDRDDLAMWQHCAVIHGDLEIATAGIVQIVDTDFPVLTRITGDLIVRGDGAASGPDAGGSVHRPLQWLTLAKLEEVRGSIDVENTALTHVSFPSLTRVGTEGLRHKLRFVQADIMDLGLGALLTVYGYVELGDLPRLCLLDLRLDAHVTGAIHFSNLYNVPYAQARALLEIADGPATLSAVACCSLSGASDDCFLPYSGHPLSMYCDDCGDAPDP